RLRIGMLNEIPGGRITMHPDCRDAVNYAARLLESAGHIVEESHPAALFEADDTGHALKLRCAEINARLDSLAAAAGRTPAVDGFEPATWAMAERGKSLAAPDVFKAIGFLEARSRRVASWWAEGHDLLLTPTMAAPPPRLGILVGTHEKPLAWMADVLHFIIFTVPVNHAGQAASSLPLSWNREGLPIGIQLVAAYGREDLLIAVAAQLEQAAPWSQRRPPVSAGA
ncbi:MAG: amidase family protein, partial [Burkholderiales bacterium]